MILITGATGFVGRYIVKELLAQGKDLRLLVRNAQSRSLPWGKLVEVVEGDVLDVLSLQKACQGVEQVVHSAAVVSFDSRRRAEMKAVNVSGTAHVVNACLEAGVKKLVHISSTAAVGKRAKVDETTKWQESQNTNFYGVTKHQAELEVHRGVVEGLPAVMLNPGVVLGPGDWSIGPPKIFETLSGGMSFYNKGITGFVAAEDVARAVALALDSGFEKGERFLLVAENLSQKEFFTQILQALGHKPPRWLLPRPLGMTVGWLAQAWAHLRGKEAFLSPESLRSSNSQTYYDASKAVRELGLQYTPVSDVIQRTAVQFLKEKGDAAYAPRG